MEDTTNTTNYYDIKALSASQIKQYAKSPYLFWKYSVFNSNRLTLETASTIFGSACHNMLLEPNMFYNNFTVCPFDNMRTKEAQEWKRREQDKTILTTKEYEHAKRMVEAIQEHPLACSLIKGLQTERPFIMEIPEECGYFLKGKIDGIKKLENGQIIVIDYKIRLR